MYSTFNGEKSIVAERFIKTFKNKIFKHMKTVSKSAYFDVLVDIFNKYNNPVHGSIKMKPIDVTSDFYGQYNEDSNKKDSKFKVGDRVGNQNIKIFLLQDILKIGQKKVLLLVKLRILFRGLMSLVI